MSWLKSLNPPWVAKVGHRIRHLLMRAPYSIFDALTSIMILWIGLHFYWFGGAYARSGGTWRPLLSWGDAPCWAVLYGGCGLVSLVITLWPRCPHFLWMLFGRMAVAFCLLLLMLSSLARNPPPVSSTVYIVLSAMAVWSILRMRCGG